MTKCNNFSAQIYILLYSVLGAVQGMGHTYLSSVLTTIEKQFGIKSQEAAWIFSGNEISQIAFIFVIPFLTRYKFVIAANCRIFHKPDQTTEENPVDIHCAHCVRLWDISLCDALSGNKHWNMNCHVIMIVPS